MSHFISFYERFIADRDSIWIKMLKLPERSLKYKQTLKLKVQLLELTICVHYAVLDLYKQFFLQNKMMNI